MQISKCLLHYHFKRSDIPKGELTYEDVFAIMPFDNTIDRVEIKGKELLDILEKAFNSSKRRFFLQVSGIKLTILNRTSGICIQSLKTLCSTGNFSPNIFFL